MIIIALSFVKYNIQLLSRLFKIKVTYAVIFCLFVLIPLKTLLRDVLNKLRIIFLDNNSLKLCIERYYGLIMWV